LENIEHTQKIHSVIKEGETHSKEKLQALLVLAENKNYIP